MRSTPPACAATSAMAGPGDERPPRDERRLLIVEDDCALRQMLCWELGELGYDVCGAGSCEAARKAAAAQSFDLAVFDLELPDGCGSDLAAELSEANPGWKIVLFSAAHGGIAGFRVPASVVAFLTKPVAVSHIDAVLRAAS